jgi:uncharacterized RDD family membrane protein YckC
MTGYATTFYTDGEFDLARAWPRFWARLFDIVLYSLPVGLVAGLLAPGLFTSLPAGRAGDILAGLLALPIVMIIDALVISYFGTSPGKAIAGLKVETFDGKKLSVETSLRRNLLVYLKGLGLGLPVICLVTYSQSYTAVRDDGTASWDDDTGTRVLGSSSNEVRTVLVAVLALAGNLAGVVFGSLL